MASKKYVIYNVKYKLLLLIYFYFFKFSIKRFRFLTILNNLNEI